MGLFRKAGERFEETKQAFTGGDGDDDGDDPEYVCIACEEAVSEDYRHCPHCGEESVEPVA